MYRSTGKPSVAKFRARLARIVECAKSGEDLAMYWNPKGRNFKVQRDMIQFFAETEARASELLGTLQHR